jgi:hypothetical protein
MEQRSPRPLTAEEQRKRRQHVVQLARELGFVGRVEYRHVYSQSGGAQYGRGSDTTVDLLMVYAEAFERDADPLDFSLEAILAHERGHQLLVRHPRLSKRLVGRLSPFGEEILASLLGAMICHSAKDRDALVGKAMVELIGRGVPVERVEVSLQELWRTLERLL